MTYDVVVIGSGPGGYVAAIRSAHHGGRVGVVEADRVGGCCLNRGCIPTKSLVKSAAVYRAAREAGEYGVTVDHVRLDWAGVMARKTRVVAELTSRVEDLLKANGIEVYRGVARIPRPGLVDVLHGRETVASLETRNVVIATGSKAQRPPVSDEAFALTISSDEALSLASVPERLLVIGGGVLGIEFACIYRGFGSQVSAVKRSPVILPAVDEELGRRLMVILKREGVTINTGVYTKDIFRTADGAKVLVADTERGEVRYEADEILVAMGRIPDFGGLDLDALGVGYSPRGIKVDSCMRTTVPGVYAVGDVVGNYYLASVAAAEGLVAADSIFGRPREMDYRTVPSCVFSHPEVASVGLTEREARERGAPVVVNRFPFSASGRAYVDRETTGLVKLVAAQDTGRLLGVHILGALATELIHEGAVALQMGASAADLAFTGFAHPTLSEAVMEAAHGVGGEMIHFRKTK